MPHAAFEDHSDLLQDRLRGEVARVAGCNRSMELQHLERVREQLGGDGSGDALTPSSDVYGESDLALLPFSASDLELAESDNSS